MHTVNHAWLGWKAILVVFLCFAFIAPSAWAWYQPGPPGDDGNFEIDAPANALDSNTYDGDDWETVYKCKVGGIGYNLTDCNTLGGFNSNLVGTTGILPDPHPQSIFWKGGSKDTNDVSQWWHQGGSVPDKDQILHAGAIAYQANDADGDQLIMYLFADRYSNDGDALMGAWFFQNEVAPDPDRPGRFIGVHKNGDVVWFGNFSGGGEVASLEIAIWNDTSLPNARAACTDNNPALPNQVGNTKLCVVAQGSGGTGTGYFASVNTGDEQSPWPFTPKQGTNGYFPYNSFFEGGINITRLLGTTPCFSSFLIESRSSTSESAQLKDFVLGNINTCKISVDKQCTSALAADKASIDHTFKIYVTNEGFAAITGVTLDDTNPSTAQDLTVNLSGDPITSGETQLVHEYTITTTTQNESNTVTAIGHAGGADTAPATDTVSCPTVLTSAQLTVTKNCSKTQLTVDNRGDSDPANDRLNVEVFYSGLVCNNNAAANAVKLFNVTATEVHNGLPPAALTTLSFPGTSGQLAVGECASFSGSYFPSAIAGPAGSNITAQNPAACTGNNPNWTDTVDATATSPLVSGPIDGTADNATCPLVCPYP